jgi:acetylornithine deacetylase/succinyl-diaminopimelate desuccinylase-like protein
MIMPLHITFRFVAYFSCCILLGLSLPVFSQNQVPKDPEIQRLAQLEAPEVLESLKELTRYDTGTGQAQGMLKVVEWIEQFGQKLGAQTERITPFANVVGPNIALVFKGQGKRKLLLIAHMDTVYPPGSASAKGFRIEGSRAIAPGIADDKGGIAVFLHVMKLLKQRDFNDFGQITLLFTSDEERGSVGSRDLIRRRAEQHDVVLSGEPTSSEEAIVLGTSGVAGLSVRMASSGLGVSQDSRPIEELADMLQRTKETATQVPQTRMNWTIVKAEDSRRLDRMPSPDMVVTFRVQGKASHAGVNPHLGVNAVMEASDLIRRVGAGLATTTGLTWHWRSWQGGIVTNMIPNESIVVMELSLGQQVNRSEILKTITNAAEKPSIAGATIQTEFQDGIFQSNGNTSGVFASADMRVPDAQAYEQLAKRTRDLLNAKKLTSASVSVQSGLGFPAYNASAEGLKLAELAQKIYADLGGRLILHPRTYGGTDAAWASQSGRPVVESLGLPGGNYHSSDEEFVLIDRIPMRLTLVAELIRAISLR